MPQVKQQIQVHLERGQFVAADALIRRALLAVPEDTEILGARSRMDIVTGGDARMAEEAWVKARWAKGLKQQKRDHELLPALPEMKALSRYNPELAEICTDTEKTRQDLDREQALAPRFDEIELLRGRGKLSAAMEKAEKILAEIPSSKKASTLVAGLRMDREQAQKSLADGKMKLLEGNLSGAASAFALAADKDESLAEAALLAENLSRSRIEKGLKLIPEGNSKTLHLCCTDSIDCGRELAVISIDDHLVSRNHCKVSLSNGQVLVEDHGSKNGTFVRGQKIETDTLQDGDLLSLAEAHDFTCKIHQAGGQVQAVVLDGENGVFAILKSRLPVRLCGADFSNASDDDELILVDGEGKRVIVQNGPGGLQILAPGRRVVVAGIKHYVEVMK